MSSHSRLRRSLRDTPRGLSPHIGNGFVCDLQGTRYGEMTDAERANYGGVTVGFGDEANIATFELTHPASHGFGYQTSIEVGPFNWTGAVLASTARANGWILLNAGGGEVTTSFGQYAGDITNTAYRAAWCDYVRTRAASTGLHRKFLDNVTGSMLVGSWFGSTPVKIPNDATFQDYYVSFLQYQQENLPGIYRLGNCGEGAGGSNRLAWWSKIAPFLDGMMIENFDGSDAHLALLVAAQDAGRDAWALIDPTADPTLGPTGTQARFLATKFASVWNRLGGGFGLVGTNVFNSNWTTPISG